MNVHFQAEIFFTNFNKVLNLIFMDGKINGKGILTSPNLLNNSLILLSISSNNYFSGIFNIILLSLLISLIISLISLSSYVLILDLLDFID